MAVRKLRGRYVVEFESRRHRIFRRLPTGATKEQAQQLEARLRHELINQVVLGKKPNVLLKTAIETWLEEAVKGRKSEDQTRSHAANIPGVEGRSLADVAEVAQAIRTGNCGISADSVERSGERMGLSAGTKNRRLCILKAVAKFAWRKGWTEDNLSGKIQLLPEPRFQPVIVTQEMAEKLIRKAPNARAKALIAFSAYTGLRLGEVLKLKPEDVKGGVILAKDTKNGTDRVIPILPQLKPHLKQLPFAANWRNVYRGFESARRRAKLTLRYHDLRHMVASALAASGGDQRYSMKLMGHKSVVTHQRYVHPDVEVMRRMLAKALPISVPGQSQRKKSANAKKAA